MQLLPRMLLVVDEIYDLTGISRSRIYKDMASGKLPYKVVGGRRRVTVPAMRAWAGLDPA
jgi:predicted DNA-binding transcriptional regulator AlpA